MIFFFGLFMLSAHGSIVFSQWVNSFGFKFNYEVVSVFVCVVLLWKLDFNGVIVTVVSVDRICLFFTFFW